MPADKPDVFPATSGKHTLVILALVLAASSVLLLWRLGDWDTTEIMELLHLQSSKEMYLTGEWIVPSLWGQMRLEKPPLPNWAAAASAHAFGRFDYFTGRLPSVLAALLMIAMTFLLARRMFPMRHVGAFSALTLGGMFFVAADQGRTAVWDIYVGAFSAGCLHACWRAMEWPGRWSIGWWLAAGVWLAAAGMSKGPVVLVIPMGVLIPMLIIDRCREHGNTRTLLRRSAGAGIMIAVAVLLCLPWVLALLQQIGDSNRAIVTWQEEILRDTPVANVDHHPLYYLLFFGMIYPASPYSVAGLITTFFPEFRRYRRAMLFAFCWVIAGLLLFSIAGERRMRYVIGLAPGAAIAAGALWARQREMLAKTEMDGKTFALAMLHWILIGSAAAAGPVACAWLGWLPWAWAIPIAAVGAMASVIGLRLHLRRKLLPAFAVGWAVAALTLMTCLSAYIDSPETVVKQKATAANVHELAQGRRIFFYPFRPSNAFGYYATQDHVLCDVRSAPEQLAAARNEGGAILLLGYAKPEDWRREPAEVMKSLREIVKGEDLFALPPGWRLRRVHVNYPVHEVVKTNVPFAMPGGTRKRINFQWYAVEMVPPTQ